MENNCSKAAANWWAEKIEEVSFTAVKNISKFEKRLSSEIFNKVSHDAYMVISTYKKRSNFLDSIALKTDMLSIIPVGYEMHISHNLGVQVYDDTGKLIAAFS